MTKVKFKQWECAIIVGSYENGNTALQLVDAEGPVAVATINIGNKLPVDQAYIKSYSENIGMLDALIDAGIVKGVIDCTVSGFVPIPLCLLDLDKCRG